MNEVLGRRQSPQFFDGDSAAGEASGGAAAATDEPTKASEEALGAAAVAPPPAPPTGDSQELHSWADNVPNDRFSLEEGEEQDDKDDSLLLPVPSQASGKKNLLDPQLRADMRGILGNVGTRPKAGYQRLKDSTAGGRRSPGRATRVAPPVPTSASAPSKLSIVNCDEKF